MLFEKNPEFPQERPEGRAYGFRTSVWALSVWSVVCDQIDRFFIHLHSIITLHILCTLYNARARAHKHPPTHTHTHTHICDLIKEWRESTLQYFLKRMRKRITQA